LALRFNKNPICKIGEVVYYTGVKPGDVDLYTERLMGWLLIPNAYYTITHINHFTCYYNYYKFLEKIACNYWYPSNCFRPVCNRSFLKAKYDLK